MSYGGETGVHCDSGKARWKGEDQEKMLDRNDSQFMSKKAVNRHNNQ